MKTQAANGDVVGVLGEIMPLVVILALTVKILSLAFNLFVPISNLLFDIASALVAICVILPSDTSRSTINQFTKWIFIFIPILAIQLLFYEATVSLPVSIMAVFSYILILSVVFNEQK